MYAIEVMCIILLFLFILYFMIQYTVTYYLFSSIGRITKKIANYKHKDKDNHRKIYPISNNILTNNHNLNNNSVTIV